MSTLTSPPRTAVEQRRLRGLWRMPPVSLPRAWRVWSRNALLFRRGWKKFVLPNFLEPLLYLLAIGLGLGMFVGDQIAGVPYAEWIAPGLAASSAMYGATFELTYNVYVKLNFHHSYDAIVTTPVEAEDIALGELLWGTTRGALYGTTFMIVVVAFGYASSWWALLSVPLLALVALSMGLLGLIFTALTPDIEMYTYYFNVFIVPLFLFSGIFFPITTLPEIAQPLAWLTPLHHGVEMNRALVLTGDIVTALQHAAWLVVFSALLVPPALNLVRRKLIQ